MSGGNPVPSDAVHALKPVSLADFLALKLPPRQCLLQPWLPERGIALLFARRGVGKTFFALEVAMAVASGGQFLCWSAPRPARVLLIDGEMSCGELQARLAEMVKRHGASPPEGNLSLLASDALQRGLPDLSTEEGQNAIAAACEEADLIILDNLSTLCGSVRENEADDWGRVQAWALAQRRAGRSVLFVHHAGKGGDQRGSSRKEDIADTVIKLTVPNDHTPAQGARFRIDFTKSRGFSGADANPLEAHLKDGTWHCRPCGGAVNTEVARLAEQGLSVRAIAAETGMSKSAVGRQMPPTRLNGSSVGSCPSVPGA